jgi:hypothetical protein
LNDFTAAKLEEVGAGRGFSTPPYAARPAVATRSVPYGYPAELADLLLPENHALPLVGRAAELGSLLDWLDQDEPQVHALLGPPGSGKTRLAVELCVRAETRGWSAGFAVDPREAPPMSHASPTIVVVDSADSRVITVAVQSAGARFRVLLLSSSPADLATFRIPQAITLPALPLDDRSALFTNAARAARRHGPRPLPRIQKDRLNDLTDPLHLTMAGLLAPTIGPQAALALTLPELAARLAELEAQRLDRAAEQAGLDPFLLRHLATCITLQHRCTITAAARIVTEEAQALGLHLPHAAASIADTLADVLFHPVLQILRPIAPGPVADAFVANELKRHSPEVRAAIITRASARLCLGPNACWQVAP